MSFNLKWFSVQIVATRFFSALAYLNRVMRPNHALYWFRLLCYPLVTRGLQDTATHKSPPLTIYHFTCVWIGCCWAFIKINWCANHSLDVHDTQDGPSLQDHLTSTPPWVHSVYVTSQNKSSQFLPWQSINGLNFTTDILESFFK